MQEKSEIRIITEGKADLNQHSRIISTMSPEGSIFIQGNVYPEDAPDLIREFVCYVAEESGEYASDLLREALATVKRDEWRAFFRGLFARRVKGEN